MSRVISVAAMKPEPSTHSTAIESIQKRRIGRRRIADLQASRPKWGQLMKIPHVQKAQQTKVIPNTTFQANINLSIRLIICWKKRRKQNLTAKIDVQVNVKKETNIC